MSRNEPIENVNVIPLVLVASDDATNSFNAVDDLETEKPAEDRPTERAPINNRVYMKKLLSAKLNDFEVKKKSFLSASKELNTSYRDCLNVEGVDAKAMEDVKNFVKNHVHEVYAPSSRAGELPEPLKVARKDLTTDLQTNVSEVDTMVNDLDRRFWDSVISVVDVNNVYYQCLAQIVDARKFQSIEDAKAHAALALRNGVESHPIGSELIACCKEHLIKFHVVLDSKLRSELTRNTHLNGKSKLDAIKGELAGNERNMKIFEDRVKMLKKEKKDLLNISQSYYNTENVNKLSLENLLKAEQETNSKLRKMISVVFKKKAPS